MLIFVRCNPPSSWLPELPVDQQLPLFDFLVKIWRYREGMIYLSPAPLYHSAPQAAVNLTIKMGGTVIIMERFDPEMGRHADLGEEVRAVVQPMPGVSPGAELAEELIAFCSQSLSRQKVPRSIDFEAELPRLPTGKLYKRLLRDRYWGNKTSRIV
jgi:hypothetical protein